MQLPAFLFLFTIVPCLCQRPFYAGLHSIGYPEVANSITVDDRFKENLPAQLNGDTAYANRLEKLPSDQQPFWYLNKKQHEDALKNPQTYLQRPSVFNDNSG